MSRADRRSRDLADALAILTGQPSEGGHRVLVDSDGLVQLLAHGQVWTAPLSVLDSEDPPPCPGCSGTIADQPVSDEGQT